MQIQHLNQSAVQGALSQDFGDAGLGRVGNLAFRGQPGATPRAPKPGLMQNLANRVSAVIAGVLASPEQRAQKQVVDAARSTSARAGDLLGALTASAQDGQAASRTSSALARLLEGMAGLPGGQSSASAMLGRHVARLDTVDVQALAQGPLSDPVSREASLSRLEPGQRRAAAALLQTIDRQVGERMVSDMLGDPLRALLGSVSEAPIDGEAVEQALRQLKDGLAQGGSLALPPSSRLALQSEAAQLDVALSSLGNASIGQLRDGLAGIDPQAAPELARLHHVLREATEGEAGKRMDRLGEALSAAMLRGAAAGGGAEALHRHLLEPLQALADDLGVDSAMPALHGVLRAAPEALRQHYFAGLSAETRQALAQPLHDAVEDQAQAVDTALRGGRNEAAAKALHGLAGALDAAEQHHAMAGDTLPRAALDTVRRVVDAFMSGDQALDQRTLAGFSDRGFGLLRMSAEKLADHGLSLDRTAVKSEVATRSAEPVARLGQEIAALLAGLQQGHADGPGLAVALRNGATSLMGLLDRLEALGEDGGADDLVSTANGAVHAALNGIDPAALAEMRGAWNEHGPALLTTALPEMKVGLARIMHRDESVARTVAYVDAAVNLADALQRELVGVPAEEAEVTQAVAEVLAGQFGVSYDPGSGAAAPVTSRAAQADFTRELTQTPAAADHGTRTHRTGSRDVAMSDTFYMDAVKRVGVSFSVTGARADGTPVAERSLVQDMDPALRAAAVDRSLDALVDVAGPAAAEMLTRIANQQITAALAQSLSRHPLPMDNGRGYMPGGGGSVHVDIEKLPAGGFNLSARVTYDLSNVGFAIDGNGNAEPAPMDPQLSHARAFFALQVSPDGSRIQMKDPVQLQHRLVSAG